MLFLTFIGQQYFAIVSCQEQLSPGAAFSPKMLFQTDGKFSFLPAWEIFDPPLGFVRPDSLHTLFMAHSLRLLSTFVSDEITLPHRLTALPPTAG